MCKCSVNNVLINGLCPKGECMSKKHAFKIACSIMTCYDLQVIVHGFKFSREQILRGKL